MKLDKRCRYDPNTCLGELESVVLYHFLHTGELIPFHITKVEYAKLNNGCGRCYGRTPWGPFCWLKVYDYRVMSYHIERDPDVLKKILEDLFL